MRKLKILACLAVATIAVGLAGCGHKQNSNVNTQSAGAGATNAGGAVVVAAGTDYTGKLQQNVSTKTSKNGDTFQIVEVKSSDPALKGAVIDGHLDNIQSAGPMRNAKMTVVFDDIQMPDGTKDPVDVQVVSTQAFDPSTHHMRTIGMMVTGAIAGHAVAKHKHGAMMGALGGYVLSQQLKTDVNVPAGTVLVLKFKSPVTAAASNGQ